MEKTEFDVQLIEERANPSNDELYRLWVHMGESLGAFSDGQLTVLQNHQRENILVFGLLLRKLNFTSLCAPKTSYQKLV